MKEYIVSMPAVGQVVRELIRCRDCKKRNQHHECEYGYHSDDWFCADGERKED